MERSVYYSMSATTTTTTATTLDYPFLSPGKCASLGTTANCKYRSWEKKGKTVRRDSDLICEESIPDRIQLQ